MTQEVVTGWAVQLSVNGGKDFLTEVSGEGTALTSYCRNRTPYVVPTMEEANELLRRYELIKVGHLASVVQVECVIKAKSWVAVADSDMKDMVYNQSQYKAQEYMRVLAFLMKEGKVRLTGMQWEVYK